MKLRLILAASVLLLFFTSVATADTISPDAIYTFTFRGGVTDQFDGLRGLPVNVGDPFDGQVSYMVGPFPTPDFGPRSMLLHLGGLTFETSSVGIRAGGEYQDGDTLDIVASFNIGTVGLIFWGDSGAACPPDQPLCDDPFPPNFGFIPIPTNLDSGTWITTHLEIRNGNSFNYWGSRYDFPHITNTSSPYLDSPFSITSTSLANVPEPSSLLLVGTGLLGFIIKRQHKYRPHRECRNQK